jgi:tellurite methyltransferase
MSKWDERYRQGENTEAFPSPLIERIESLAKPGRALDIACGPGRHSVWLAERGWDVTGVDSSQVALDLLKNAAPSVHCVCADLEKGEFEIEPASWDLILDFHYLQRDLFPQMRSGVRFGGLFAAQIRTFAASRAFNPQYLLERGELLGYFEGWKIEHWIEGPFAELIARRPVDARDATLEAS